MLRVFWAGKTRDSLLRELVQRYAARIEHCAPFRLEEVQAGRGSRKGEAATAEGERFLTRLPRDGTVVALDAGGRKMTTEAFAGWLEGALSRGSGEVVFVVGGQEGLALRFDEAPPNQHLNELIAETETNAQRPRPRLR